MLARNRVNLIELSASLGCVGQVRLILLDFSVESLLRRTVKIQFGRRVSSGGYGVGWHLAVRHSCIATKSDLTESDRSDCERI